MAINSALAERKKPPSFSTYRERSRREEPSTMEYWISEAQAGNAEAFDKLSEPLRAGLRRFFQSRVRDDSTADTLVQTTLIEAFRHISTFKNECPFDRWVYKIGLYSLYHHFRKNSRSSDMSLDAFAEEYGESIAVSEESRFDEQVESEDWIQSLITCAKQACTDAEVATLLVYYRTGSLEETAIVMQMKPATARSHFMRGRAALLSFLIFEHPDLVGGERAIESVVRMLLNTPPPEGMTSDEGKAFLEADPRSPRCRAACVKIARHLPNPLSTR